MCEVNPYGGEGGNREAVVWPVEGLKGVVPGDHGTEEVAGAEGLGGYVTIRKRSVVEVVVARSNRHGRCAGDP